MLLLKYEIIGVIVSKIDNFAEISRSLIYQILDPKSLSAFILC